MYGAAFGSHVFYLLINRNDRKIGANVVALVNKLYTASEKYCTANFCIHASNGPVIILNGLNVFIIDAT